VLGKPLNMRWLNKLQEPWGLMRILRLALALWLFYDAYHQQNWWMAVFGVFILYQVIENVQCTSCEQTGSCDISVKKENQLPVNDVIDKELK